jgi:SAM-dependent methyltransferase
MERGHTRLRKQYRQNLGLKLHRCLYRGVDGFSISTAYRTTSSATNLKALTYGEVNPKSFLQILSYIEQSSHHRDSTLSTGYEQERRLFVDLGCGVGRACISAALSIDDMFTGIIGIDIVPGLIDQAKIVKDQLDLHCERLKTIERIDSASLAISASPKSHATASHDELLSCLKDFLSQSNEKRMKMDSLANSLCKMIGHKRFKTAIKPFRGFANYLSTYPQYFRVTSIEVEVIGSIEDIIGSHVADDKNEDVHSAISSKHTINNILRENRETLLQYVLPIPPIDYIVSDIFEVEWWRDCFVAYAASLLFSDEMMDRLTNQAMNMSTGSWLISLKSLILSTESRQQRIKLQHQSFFDMSWEMAEVFIYRIYA